jgi:hypothetical protein
MAQYNPNLSVAEERPNNLYCEPATPSAPDFEPYLEVDNDFAESGANQGRANASTTTIFSLEYPLLIFLVLCLLVVALESVKIARAGATRTQSVFAAIVAVLLMFVFFLLGVWLLLTLTQGQAATHVSSTAIAIALPFVLWLVTSVTTSSALGTTYRLFD